MAAIEILVASSPVPGAGAGTGTTGDNNNNNGTPRIHDTPAATATDTKSSEAGEVEIQMPSPPATAASAVDSSVGYIPPPHAITAEDFRELVPSPCYDACRFNCMALWCVLIFLVFPFAVLLSLASNTDDNDKKRSYQIACGVIAGVGFCYFLFSLRRTILGGVCCKPDAPAQTGPLSRGNETHQQVKPRKLYVIVNPFGGLKQGLSILDTAVLPIWQQAGIEATVLKTEYAGHARVYAATVPLDGYDGICVIGGDGSFHEMLNGLLSRKDQRQIPVGLIPGGSGNSVGYDLGLFDAKEAAQRIATGSSVAVDANRVTDDGKLLVYSINEVSWGVVGDVGVTAEAIRCCGPARYDICAIWAVLKGSTGHLKLVMDGDNSNTQQGEFVSAFVNQTQHFGKGLRATPLAKIDDGFMDLCFMKEGTRGEQLEIFLQLPAGNHHQHPGLTFKQVKELTMIPKKPAGILNIDGEIMRYDGAVRIQCVHRAFRMFIPPDCRGPVKQAK